MKLNDLQSTYETKISRINHWLEETYGFKVFDKIDVEKLFQVKADLDAQRESLKNSLPFNSYHTHPDYTKNILLSEAIVLMIGQVPDEAVDQMQNADGEDSPVGSVDTEIPVPESNEKETVKEQEDLEKAETVLASQQMVDEFQQIIEDLGKMQNETLGALVDRMTYEFGADAAANFSNNMNATIQGLLDGAREAKEKAQNEVLTLQGEQPASTMDTDADGSMDTDMDTPSDDDSLELDEPASGDDSASGPEDEPLGRAKKA
jgi:hypothetical protein